MNKALICQDSIFQFYFFFLVILSDQRKENFELQIHKSTRKKIVGKINIRQLSVNNRIFQSLNLGAYTFPTKTYAQIFAGFTAKKVDQSQVVKCLISPIQECGCYLACCVATGSNVNRD